MHCSPVKTILPQAKMASSQRAPLKTVKNYNKVYMDSFEEKPWYYLQGCRFAFYMNMWEVRQLVLN